MIKFLLKGILRDRSRSVLLVIIISLGVMLTVLLSGYIRGVMGDIINQNARLETGHVKVMTRAYLENKSQLPNDLALLGIEELIYQLQSQFPTVLWEKRIRFGGLIDAPDENGLTKRQGPAVGMALDLLTTETKGIERLNLRKSLVTGAISVTKGEALISDDFAKKLDIEIGDEVTYVGKTMNDSMTFQNFKVSGTILFGSPMMDKGAILVDITAAQQMLDMADGSSELLDYFPDEKYDDETATEMSEQFNQQYAETTDEFSLVMRSLKQQDNLAGLIDIANMGTTLFVTLLQLPCPSFCGIPDFLAD
ncbi:MAG: putative ABC transport system permease protein [Spirosomataceae bacterium]|jgi:putative ABC transport system permease protein